MIIRAAEASDFEQVAALMHYLNPSDPVMDEGYRDTYLGIVADRHLHLLVVDIEGRLVASCYLNVVMNLTRGGRPYAVIENVITNPAYRNQGIGSELLRQAVDLAWQENCYKIMLMSGRNNPTVHSFYRNCGFDAEQKQAYILRSE